MDRTAAGVAGLRARRHLAREEDGGTLPEFGIVAALFATVVLALAQLTLYFDDRSDVERAASAVTRLAIPLTTAPSAGQRDGLFRAFQTISEVDPVTDRYHLVVRQVTVDRATGSLLEDWRITDDAGAPPATPYGSTQVLSEPEVADGQTLILIEASRTVTGLGRFAGELGTVEVRRLAYESTP